jgi:hypothetical protein
MRVRMTDNRSEMSHLAASARSRKTLERAMRLFLAIPSTNARTAVELAMEAVQRADLLQTSPEANRGEPLRHWTDAWIAAHVAVYRLQKHRRAN